MDDLLKKFVNTGVGLLAQGNKRVQTVLDKLVHESKLSEQEGQKIMDDLRRSGEAKRADLEKQFTKLTADLRTRVGLAKEEKAQPAAKKASPKKPAAEKAATGTKKATDKAGAASKPQKSATVKADAGKVE